MCSLTHKITHYCGWADTSHRMTKSCHTTLFVWEWPRTFSPYATLWKWKAEKQEIPYSFKYCHSSVLLSVTFSLQKQTPLQRKSFHTTVLYFSLMLCLPGAGRHLPPTQGPISAGIGREREQEALTPALLCLGQEVALVTSSQRP